MAIPDVSTNIIYEGELPNVDSMSEVNHVRVVTATGSGSEKVPIDEFTLPASQIKNGSSVAGATVDDALTQLNTDKASNESVELADSEFYAKAIEPIAYNAAAPTPDIPIGTTKTYEFSTGGGVSWLANQVVAFGDKVDVTRTGENTYTRVPNNGNYATKPTVKATIKTVFSEVYTMDDDMEVGYYTLNGGVGATVGAITINADWRAKSLTVKKGDIYIIYGVGYVEQKLYALTTSANVITEIPADYFGTNLGGCLLRIQSDGKLFVNFKYSYTGSYFVKLNTLGKEVYNQIDFQGKGFVNSGFVSNTGVVIANATYRHTNLILVDKSTPIEFIALLTNASVNAISFYDKSGAYISGVSNVAGAADGDIYTISEDLIPTNAFYMRLCTLLKLTGISYVKNGNINNYLSKISSVVECDGDSLTAGAGTTIPATESYPAILQTYLGKTSSVLNYGVGGETILGILARQGSHPAILPFDITLPANTSAINIAYGGSTTDGLINGAKFLLSSFDKTSIIVPIMQGSAGVNDAYIGNIAVTITKTYPAEGTSAFTYWKIARKTAGTRAVKFKAGTPIIMAGASVNSPNVAVLWLGQNGGYSSVADYVQMNATAKRFKNAKYNILMSPPHAANLPAGATIEQIEDAMLKEFGSSYLNIRKYLITDAIYEAQADGLISTITQEDIDRMEIYNVIPKALLHTDFFHLNSIGYKMVAKTVYNRLLQLGFI